MSDSKEKGGRRMMNSHLSQKEALGAFFGFGMWSIGVAAAVLGVWGIYAENETIGGLLVFMGLAIMLLGAHFASMPAEPKREVPLVGNYLFGLCFVSSVFILIVGMVNIFNTPMPSLYLMAVAILSAAIAAWSVVRRSQLG
jgi:hypothetical protein